ncbi:30S ribosomal protein S12 methylthiotransferase accessory factor YcaO [Craterilacuibacter sinensis]|uniref:30s ribosomal protein S12 methylthiotransferase accessory protein YcaO n=1 Tax=Craterilacuibacter sinensis TaxID=2686017 RepID=A0A845BIN2_9NEIS|nr:30S ribosomal protein S12 methylthiotransferase accessory factor YcaO [Craterilacuibacter sinensis]MXR36059.1 30s ribosomal protein S12 methylthiotransferase accessory protein YcaO [Craterilacuibacter sinensis]
MQHFIPGKDAALEDSIATMQGKLAARGFNIEEVSWLNPVDNCWSVHIRDRDCPLLFTNGKGASELAARASALGEMFERLSCHYFWTHFYLGEERANRPFVHYPQERWFALPQDDSWPEGLLNEDLLAFYNPDDAIEAATLVDLNSGNGGRGICALPYTRVSDGAQSWIPVNIIGNLYVSNGMSAGNTQPEARTQALSEILERHIKFRIIAEGICLPDVPEDVIARYPRIAAGIQGLRDAGFGILVKDASLGGRYPVMNVTMLHPHDQGVFASFGAHPSFEVALERALTELLQGRALDALAGFPEAGMDMDEVASPSNLETHFVDSAGIIGWPFLAAKPDFAFEDWDFKGSTQQDYERLCAIIHEDEFEIYVSDFTELGVYACRILVPGMSEIYQVDDLEWENNSVGNSVRPAILNLHALDEAACAGLLRELQVLGLADHRSLWEILGLAVPEGSAWKNLRMGELKTLLALACGDKAAIREGLEWIHHFRQIADSRYHVYRCIETLLDLDGEGDFRPSLALLYGADTLSLAEDLLAQRERFFGLSSPGLALEGLELHQRLLQAYDKLF